MGKIVLKSDGKIIHKESKTFDRRAAAAAWIQKRETQIREQGPDKPKSTVTVAQAIEKYETSARKKIGRTNAQVLKSIRAYDFAGLQCAAVTSQEIVKFAQALATDKSPQTVGNYLSHLSAVFAIAQPAWDIPLDPGAMKSARAVLKRLGAIGRSEIRDRRPTMAELEKIMEYFAGRKAGVAPMTKIAVLAPFIEQLVADA
jgi:hypothetical protein